MSFLFLSRFHSRRWRARCSIPWKLLLVLFVPCSVSAQEAARGVAAERRAVAFQYISDRPARTVCVAGTFNGWNKSSDPLALAHDGKTWRTTLKIAPGSYQYRFVINGDTWLNDPNAPGVDDGNSNLNSLLIVLPRDYELRPGRLGDGVVTASALRHTPDRADTLRLDDRQFLLSLRTRRNDVETCRLLWLGAKGALRTVGMTRYDADALYDYWRGTAVLEAAGPLSYAFLLQDGKAVFGFDRRNRLIAVASRPATPGEIAPQPPIPGEIGNVDLSRFQWFAQDPAAYPILQTPDWPRDAVFYQIFPDRFANGDPTNDGPGVQPWGTPPTHDNRMGGDLAGVLQHFDYLKDLGVNALYFNPLFVSESNHGYDTSDYLHVDPRFGDNDLLVKLVAKAHDLHWRVILDGVFNHSGVNTPQFRSLREQGARSPYRNWYTVKKFPIEVKEGQQTYASWFGVPSMPKLNLANPETRASMLHVATYWIEQAHIDGWRLDAAEQVPHDYWIDFHKAVRRADPNALILGEIWNDAHEWLQGDQFDTVMNYRWRAAVLDFLAADKLTPLQFDLVLARLRDDYPSTATNVMFNTLGSHDTVRLRTLCQGDRRRQMQAVLVQMTYPGTPCIYYGDEIGMEGGKDPDERRCMIWDKSRWDGKLLEFYRKILAVRRDHTVLRRGDYRTMLVNDAAGLFGYLRADGAARALVLLNRSDKSCQARLPLRDLGDAPLSDLLDSGAVTERQGDHLLVTLPPRGYALLGTP